MYTVFLWLKRDEVGNLQRWNPALAEFGGLQSFILFI